MSEADPPGGEIPGVLDLGFAQLDTDRAARRGFAEVIYGAGKTPAQLAEIFDQLAARGPDVLATRVDPPGYEAVRARRPDAKYDALARVVYLQGDAAPAGLGEVLVLAAGTSDLPVAREALVSARVLGNRAELITDIGVAGLHRLLGHLPRIREARVLIVCAGMEGALPTVVAGLVDRPVIAVPTSVGYGTAFGGVTALLGMLNSCSGGISVVNIDNGFGAALNATLMNRP